jgi:hypothetical protein
VASADTRALVERAVTRLRAQVPALQPLKLIVGLELRGRGDVQLYRVELPELTVTKDPARDARVRVSVARTHFNELATDGRLRDWREAIENGHVSVSGPDQILKLVGNVVAREEERARTPKAR